MPTSRPRVAPFWLMLASLFLGDPAHAQIDPRLDSTCLAQDPWPTAKSALQAFYEPIPRRIVQIWFGPYPSHLHHRMESWKQVASQHGYDYRLYTDADVPEIIKGASPANLQLFFRLKFTGELRGLSDLARYLLLEKQGGLYVDADIQAPALDTGVIDPARYMPLHGLVVVSDGAAVDWGSGGVHALNGVLASSAHHPVLISLLQQAPVNTECCQQHAESNPVLQTGPMPLTHLLNGPVTILPVAFWEQFGIPDASWR